MAKMRNGVFSNPAGKIGGVVFARWKNTDYGRSYSVPANPNTINQQTQRTKMTRCVQWCRELVYSVFNKYYDPFEKDRSAYNAFVKYNLTNFGTVVNYMLVQLGRGSLYPAIIQDPMEYENSTKTLTVTFSTENGYNGAATDQVALVAYNVTKNTFHYSYEGTERSTGENTVVLDGAEQTDEVFCWTIAYTESGGMVRSVSTSDVMQKSPLV